MTELTEDMLRLHRALEVEPSAYWSEVADKAEAVQHEKQAYFNHWKAVLGKLEKAEAERDEALRMVLEVDDRMAKLRQCVRDREAEALDAMAEADELRAFASDCYKNWDCDGDAHRYGTTCRACEAASILSAGRKKRAALSPTEPVPFGHLSRAHPDDEATMNMLPEMPETAECKLCRAVAYRVSPQCPIHGTTRETP
jgi:hypothetical protein